MKSFFMMMLGWALLWMTMQSVLHASMEILQVEANPDGSVHLLFEDSDPPVPYTLQQFDSLNQDSPWNPIAWDQLTCVQPATFEMRIPNGVQDAEFYRIAIGAGTGLPLVIATDPANGATSVSPEIEKMSVTFDRPMDTTVAVEADSNWGASFSLWSNDYRTVEIYRLSPQTPLPSQSTIHFTLNPGGDGFCDLEGRILPAYALEFTTGTVDIAGPHVVSSFPASGATSVDPYIDTVEFRFNEPMMPTGGFFSQGWWPWTLTWSADGMTAYAQRATAGTPLYSHTVIISPFGFRAIDGEELAVPYTLQFTTADPLTQRLEANPEKGFYWPYYLVIPEVIQQPGTLLVEPNNTGTWGDDPWFHESAALSLLRWRGTFAVELGCPLLIPVFPRPQNPAAPEPGGIYVHALDRYSLSDQWSGLERIDLQIVAMIDDALERLETMGHSMDTRVFMMGFSASGAFTSRFSILHPERLKAAAAGSPGGWPLAPVASWQSTQLPYPMGVQDVLDLTGEAFDQGAFQQVPLYIYVGGSDTNDALDFRGMSTAQADAIKQLFNYPNDRLLANRWPLAESMYTSVGANATFVVYPGVGHTITEQMFEDLLNFFVANR